MQEKTLFEALAPLLRVTPEFQNICRFGGQWASAHVAEPDGWAPFHMVTAGACGLDIPNEALLTLYAGDVAVLPHGGPHVVRACSSAGGIGAPIRSIARVSDEISIKTNLAEGAVIETGLVCGRFRFEQASHNTVLAALPACIVVSASAGGGEDAARISAMIGLMRDEFEGDRAGAAAVAGSLALAVMLIVLRAHLATASSLKGALALLQRPQTARALMGMLGDPARNWSLDGLAERSMTSRATLVRQFQAAVGMAPLAYLASIRLTIARGRIRSSHSPLAVIAEEVGYQSETAFNRAYQRQFRIAPGGDRSARP